MSHKKCHCGEEFDEDGCCPSGYTPDMTVKCIKCGQCFNPDVSGDGNGVCDTCHLESKDRDSTSTQTPDWKDMPEGITLATLSWEDVYIKAREELERNPTREETIEMFDEMAHSMRNATQDDMPAQLDALITEIVTGCLKSKPYDIDAMTDQQLTSKKYCHECKEIQETFWEVNFCDKNPEGIEFDDAASANHGNDDTCEDGYCNPDSVPVEDENITPQYVKEHAVFEKCTECHQYFDSAGPQTGAGKTQ